MKAVQIEEYGDTSVLNLRDDVPKPSPRTGQVLVKIHASSINPFDSAVLRGYAQKMMPLILPVTLGGDVAGTVEEVGPGVHGFKPGDKVYGQANAVSGNSGAFAEYTATAANQLGHMPSGLSFLEAGAIPLTGVSALQALRDHLKLKSGQRILIQGGSGGIGTAAIQLAKHLGAYVATTVPGEATDYAEALGADEAIDYEAEDFSTKIKDYDAVLDLVGGEVFEKSFGVVKKGATLVSMTAKPNEERARKLGVTAIAQGTRVNTEMLSELRSLIEKGIIKVYVDRVFDLEHIQDAFAARESGDVRGKVVLAIA
jgi:alcohol dehydrogenase